MQKPSHNSLIQVTKTRIVKQKKKNVHANRVQTSRGFNLRRFCFDESVRNVIFYFTNKLWTNTIIIITKKPGTVIHSDYCIDHEKETNNNITLSSFINDCLLTKWVNVYIHIVGLKEGVVEI